MKSRLLAALLLLIAPIASRADYEWEAGRTGLPTVREGGETIWLDHGYVAMHVIGNDLLTRQDFGMQCPGPNMQRAPVRIRIAVREDYFRSQGNGEPPLRLSDAHGFRRFVVWVDGRRVDAMPDEWMLNEKGDTATRWRNWYVWFRPGQRRFMRIETLAPLGREGRRHVVEFVSKDLGHWRDNPDLIQITLTAPGTTTARLAGVEPRPSSWGPNMRWVYRNAHPDHDLFVLLPADYPGAAYRRPRWGYR